MNRNIGYAHFGLETVRLRNISMACVNHQGSAEFAGVDDSLHFCIAAVIVAHKANLHQTLSVCDLGSNDFFTVLGTLCKRFLTEYIFPVRQAF